MKRKILILATWYPSAASPVNGIFIHDQAVALSREYDVAVLAPRLVGWREMLQGKLDSEPQWEQRNGLVVCRERAISPLPRAPRLMYWRYRAATERGFNKLLAQWGKPDLIHAHVVLPGGWAAACLGKRHSIPVVLHEHSSPFAMHLTGALQRHRVEETLSQVDRIIAVSPALARQIQQFYNKTEICVIGNLIKTDFFVLKQNHAPKADTHFISIALLSKQKGLRYLLQAAQLLVQRGVTSFDITIGGDGPERAPLENMVQELGLADRCRFLGLLTPIEVRDRIQQSDVMVMPSLHETFCIVLGEAMACGKPVIATRCGGPEFVVTPETGVLVEVADPQALANAMGDFILGKIKFNSQRVRQSVVERFGEEAFLRQISAVYEQVWSKPR
ncbi:MAG: glycosyltransferase [bacterium]